jgi:hypothetical protein
MPEENYSQVRGLGEILQCRFLGNWAFGYWALVLAACLKQGADPLCLINDREKLTRFPKGSDLFVREAALGYAVRKGIAI